MTWFFCTSQLCTLFLSTLARGAVALAVHDAHASQAGRRALLEKTRQLKLRLGGGQAMEIQVRLHRELTAAQLADDCVLHALSLEIELVAHFELTGAGIEQHHFAQHGGLVAGGLLGDRWWRRRAQLDGVGNQWPHAGQRLQQRLPVILREDRRGGRASWFA